MADGLSAFERFKRWLRDRKIDRALSQLRRDGELQRILDGSPYTYLRPGSSQGDDWFHVHRRDAMEQEKRLYSALRENDVVWWIVERSRVPEGHPSA